MTKASRSSGSKPSSSSAGSKSSRLELIMVVQNLATASEKFTKAAEAMQEYDSAAINELDLTIEEKRNELNHLSETFEVQKKDGQIRTDQYLMEYKYTGACEILKDRNEVPIRSDELSKMKSQIADFTKERSVELDAIRKEEKERAAKQLQYSVRTLELEHKASIASTAAAVTQLQKETESKEQTIENLRHELSEQRKLTKEVAEAGKQAPIHVNSGSSGR